MDLGERGLGGKIGGETGGEEMFEKVIKNKILILCFFHKLIQIIELH